MKSISAPLHNNSSGTLLALLGSLVETRWKILSIPLPTQLIIPKLSHLHLSLISLNPQPDNDVSLPPAGILNDLPHQAELPAHAAQHRTLLSIGEAVHYLPQHRGEGKAHHLSQPAAAPPQVPPDNDIPSHHAFNGFATIIRRI